MTYRIALLLGIFLSACTTFDSQSIEDAPYRRAIEIRESGDSEESLPRIEAVAFDYEKKHDWFNAFRAYRSAALLAEAVGNHQKMLAHAKKSYETGELYFKDASERRGMLRAANLLLAQAYLAVNDPESAVPLLRRVLPRRIPQSRKQAQIYGELHGALGDAYQKLGNLNSALQHHQEGLRVQEQVLQEVAAQKAASKRRSILVPPPVRDRYLRHLTSVVRDHLALGEVGQAERLAENLAAHASNVGFQHWEAEASRLRGDIAL